MGLLKQLLGYTRQKGKRVMGNNLNFTNEMKEMMKEWKGKLLKGYIENSDDGYFSIARLLIEDRLFDLDNEYVLYDYPDNDRVELTCFACVEVDKKKALQTHIVGGKCKENIVGENIVNVYIIKDVEKGKLFDSGIPYELEFDTALIIQTENGYYAFWRDVMFYTIEAARFGDMEAVLKAVKSVEQIQKEAQEENPYVVTVERRIAKL